MSHKLKLTLPLVSCMHTCSSIANNKDRVADMEKLFQLNYLQDKQLFRLQPLLLEG